MPILTSHQDETKEEPADSTPVANQGVLYPAVTEDYAVSNNLRYGMGLVANRNIKKGGLVFQESLEYTFGDVEDGDYLVLDRHDEASKITSSKVPAQIPISEHFLWETHGMSTYCPDPTGKSGGLLWCGLECPTMLMNHSCDPNVVTHGDPNISSEAWEDYAARDIQKGEELTVDYVLGCYHPFLDDCQCGATNCRGAMEGFMNLSDEEKQRLWPRATDATKAQHNEALGVIAPLKEEQPQIVERPPKKNDDDHDEAFRFVVPGPSCAEAPISVEPDPVSGEICLYATKEFKAGQKVYEYWSQPWPVAPQIPIDMVFATPLFKGDPMEGTTVRVWALDCASRRQHTGTYMMTGWDLLTKDSNVEGCEPNILKAKQVEDEAWQCVYAASDIQVGDKLTADYSTILWDRSASTQSSHTDDDDIDSDDSVDTE